MTSYDRIEKLAQELRVPPGLPPGLRDAFNRGIRESDASRRLRIVETSLGIEPMMGQLGARIRRAEDAAHNPLGGINPKVSLILFGGIYSVDLLRRNPDKIFVFGDNNGRVGKGGQAIIRDEPNALGVSTKVSVDKFMTDCVPDMGQVCEDLNKVEQLLQRGKRVVIHITPEKRISLGCGLAQLPYRAPRIYGFIEHWFENMKAQYRHTTI